MVGLFGQLDERAVGQRIATDHPRAILLAVVLAIQRDANSRRAFHDVVVGQNEAGFIDDEAGAGRLHHLFAWLLWLLWILARLRLSEKAFEQIAAAAPAAAEEVTQVLGALPLLGPDVDDSRGDRLGDVAECGGRERSR